MKIICLVGFASGEAGCGFKAHVDGADKLMKKNGSYLGPGFPQALYGYVGNEKTYVCPSNTDLASEVYCNYGVPLGKDYSSDYTSQASTETAQMFCRPRRALTVKNPTGCLYLGECMGGVPHLIDGTAYACKQVHGETANAAHLDGHVQNWKVVTGAISGTWTDRTDVYKWHYVGEAFVNWMK